MRNKSYKLKKLNENEIEKKYNFINYLKKKIIKIIEIKSKK